MNDKITFGDNINKTGKSAESQVNAFVPIKSFLLLKERCFSQQLSIPKFLLLSTCMDALT